MNAADLERFLHQHIPISSAMEISVVESSPAAVRLRASLAPNVNHRHTAFGGSVASLGILSAWSLLRVNLDGLDPLPHIVIQRTEVEYLDPIAEDFDARSLRPADDVWTRFLHSLTRRGKARMKIGSELFVGDRRVGELRGSFVAFHGEPPRQD
jgi:thioesterase domain-containing protein